MTVIASARAHSRISQMKEKRYALREKKNIGHIKFIAS